MSNRPSSSRRDDDRERDRDRDRERDGGDARDSRRDDDRNHPSSSRRDHHDDRYHHRSSDASRRDDGSGRERDSKRSRKEQRSDDDEEQLARKKDKLEKKERKAQKQRETSTERSMRKAVTKAAKAADAALLLPPEARLAAAEVSFYSSTDNPFHDANLGERFVWGKKREKERKGGMSMEEARRRDAERAVESQQEIERLNARRAEREVDLQLREEESMRAARMAESAQMSAWIDREDDFHLEQAKKRAEIRVRERRAKPIDFLALNLKWSRKPLVEGEEGFEEQEEEEEDEGLGLDVDMEEPYTIFDNLTLEDSEELHEDIKMYLSLEKLETNLEFWRSLLIVSSSSLESLRSARSIGIAQSRANANVKSEITRLLSNKSLQQLNDLQAQVQLKLSSDEVVDVEYWEGLLKELVVWKAKGKLGDMHEVVLNNRLEQLRQKQRDEAIKYQAEVKYALHAPSAASAAAGIGGEGFAEAYEKEDGAGDDMDLDDGDDDGEAKVVVEAWDEASMEPKVMSKVSEEYRSCPLVDADLDLARLYAQRKAVVQTRFISKAKKVVDAAPAVRRDAKAEEIYQAAVGQGFDHEEELFSMEAQITTQAYTWEDKYRPRKPRYFNKVHTGYEWNKYNQTHYDTDNPPPKVVQGYKFNIFYPDLIDKLKAPTYKVIRTKGNDDTCILLFKAGPPYEDLAFTIVNKEWEYSHKRGFRSSFDRGVLQVYVNFKRSFYRK